jgi:NAD(P)-dependent dehydrogenase (short-subunit alcohol dehydrogenase family)
VHLDNILAGKACLVTGASRALGAAIAREFARSGARVAVNYNRSSDAALALCQELEAYGAWMLALQADVTDPAQAADLVSRAWTGLGRLDAVVNNVGPWIGQSLSVVSFADFERILTSNLTSTFTVAREAGNRMKADGGGHIVNISATDAFERGRSVYGLAKDSVIHLTEALAFELAPYVRVNAIAPGLIADNEDMTDTLIRGELARTPLGRLVSRAEIAEVACLLCTDAFASVTGQTIVMDGGARIPHSYVPHDT